MNPFPTVRGYIWYRPSLHLGMKRDDERDLEQGQEYLKDTNVLWIFLEFLSLTSKELLMVVAFSSQLAL